MDSASSAPRASGGGDDHVEEKKMIRNSFQIVYCLGELQMLSNYTDRVDMEEVRKIRKEYRRRFG